MRTYDVVRCRRHELKQLLNDYAKLGWELHSYQYIDDHKDAIEIIFTMLT